MMSVCTEDNVITGPWKKRPKRKVILQNEQIIEEQENMMFCDTLTEGLLIQMVCSLENNGFEIESEDFLRDIRFIIESVRSLLYRELNLEHPMSELIRSFTKETTPPEEIRSFDLDIERLGDTLKRFRDDDEKETE